MATNNISTRVEFESILREGCVWEPLDFAETINPKRVNLVLGALDTVVPFEKGMELREALGKPRTTILPTGHYVALLYLKYIESQAFKFFERRFSEVERSKK